VFSYTVWNRVDCVLLCDPESIAFSCASHHCRLYFSHADCHKSDCILLRESKSTRQCSSVPLKTESIVSKIALDSETATPKQVAKPLDSFL
jgi:hypothetical protein